MKIVSLQSVGLGAAQSILNGYKYNQMKFLVGEIINDGSVTIFDDISSLPKITEINYQQGDFDSYGFEIYTVHTSDGHIRVLPADKYIAEWSE
ncbi:hypothetical protein EFN46_10715 [Leuconostoc pseudomesenteroides]|uniref:hypothetical protein n=1 Tax=Leuconostoc pseudomesenteroides TaxID=33968 RepID=UPI0021A9F7C5|nr:hypothetical protein [Leuconostoc pseudomesenteroides]MCT4388665.1 hypothetical protein [Leuconostoc pseudomesenteroides]